VPDATSGKLSVESRFCPKTGPGAPRGPEGRRRRLGGPGRGNKGSLISNERPRSHRRVLSVPRSSTATAWTSSSMPISSTTRHWHGPKSHG